MRIHTRTGDDGTTGLFGGGRVDKNHPRVQAYGAVDELNAVLGVARAVADGGAMAELLGELQQLCFVVGSDLATQEGSKAVVRRIGEADVLELERRIDEGEAGLPALSSFILPGGTAVAAHLHHARTVCRRAERHVVGLLRDGEVSAEVLKWVNRLSDLLFVLARVANYRAGVEDVAWVSE